MTASTWDVTGAEQSLDANRSEARRIRHVGLTIVLLIFVGAGSWSLLAPLSSAALAPGIVAVENYRKTIQHLEGGIVRSIEVRDGDVVEAGEVLLTLDSTQPRAQLEVLRGQYFFALGREALLVALRDGADEVQFPPALLDSPGDDRARESMTVNRRMFEARRASQDNEIALYTEQVSQLQAKVDGLASQRSSRQRLVDSYIGELKDFDALLAEGYAEKQTVRDLERRLAEAEGDLGDLVSEVAATRLQISETRLKILQLEKELQEEVAAELGEVQAELFELRERIQSLEDTVDRTVVRAPQSGVVLRRSVHTLGAVIRPGDAVMEIIPRDERLVIEARIGPVDIDRVREGQVADIRFSAFKMRDTPRIEGTVMSISADSLVDETERDAQPYYLARVEISDQGLEDLARSNLDLVAGMPAEVLINTGQRTLFEYLIDPLRNTVARSFIED